MEETLDQSEVFIPRDVIRIIQSEIKAQLDKYAVDTSDTTFLETSNACDCVRDQILYYEDEPHLSKSQNNCRRIFIASELLISICSVYWDVVDYEFLKSVCDLVQWEKYKKLSREIRQKIQLESKIEKNFANEALNKLKEAEIRISEEEVVRQETPQLENTDLEEENVTGFVRKTPTVDQQTVETTENGAPHETLEDMTSSFLQNMTTMRDEPVANTSRQQFPISNISNQDMSVPETAIETSIQPPEIQDKHAESLREILEVLEDQIPQADVGAIEQPETLLESTDKLPSLAAPEERPPDDQLQAASSEGSEKWSLPSLESVETVRRRRRHLMIDEETVIHQYAERAMRLNRNINTQRVEVFEGPPDILQAFSAGHLMTTPTFRTSSIFRDVRSEKLSTLYNRHLKTGTRPVEPIHFERRAVDEEKHDISRARINLEIVEEVGVRAGMHSAAEKSGILAEVSPKRSRMGDLETAPAAIPPIESIIGMPVSRIMNSTIQPLEETQLERINNVPVSPTVRRFQGQSVDPKTTPPWFSATKENPPSAKYREFNYVYKNIQRYWLLFEDERDEKCVTLREFLSLEAGESIANFLTVLRIVDKMSIQRKLRLEYKGGDVFIRPFESHFRTTSSGQLELQREESF